MAFTTGDWIDLFGAAFLFGMALVFAYLGLQRDKDHIRKVGNKTEES